MALVCVDADYRLTDVVTACVVFEHWSSAVPRLERVFRVAGVPAAYEPGSFYKRELPHLCHALLGLGEEPEIVIIDGYVWLAAGAPGLGAHLHEALPWKPVVVGIAKRPFRAANASVPVTRGSSTAPLFVTAAGMAAADAARAVLSMRGPHRIPTLCKRADGLCRNAPVNPTA